MKFMDEKFIFNTPEEIISDIQQGKIVIITDDESRENEGDFVFAAQFVDSDKINFLAKHGRGLICVPLTEERVTQLGIQDMVGKNTDPKNTAFTVSVDARYGISTGISASDRARTIEVLMNSATQPKDLVMPGHIFPPYLEYPVE